MPNKDSKFKFASKQRKEDRRGPPHANGHKYIEHPRGSGSGSGSLITSKCLDEVHMDQDPPDHLHLLFFLIIYII